jgi:hypothetical protein
MRWLLFSLAWLFIGSTALYDAHFAWQYRAELQSWELNPLARWCAGNLGLVAVFAFKLAGLLFAGGLAIYCRCCRPRLEPLLTLTIAGVYALLALHYLHIAHQPDRRIASRLPAHRVPLRWPPLKKPEHILGPRWR